MVVAIVVDLLNFKAIKLAFYRFASHVFQRIRRWVGGNARLNSEQFARPLLLVTFVERCVTRLRDAHSITNVELPAYD